MSDFLERVQYFVWISMIVLKDIKWYKAIPNVIAYEIVNSICQLSADSLKLMDLEDEFIRRDWFHYFCYLKVKEDSEWDESINVVMETYKRNLNRGY